MRYLIIQHAFGQSLFGVSNGKVAYTPTRYSHLLSKPESILSIALGPDARVIHSSQRKRKTGKWN